MACETSTDVFCRTLAVETREAHAAAVAKAFCEPSELTFLRLLSERAFTFERGGVGV